ncbi:hypothetical protein HK405_008237 [Cladochytrium tenue]|nr:hypothetical protein HK405_008237 [Cladochytrium tenue]
MFEPNVTQRLPRVLEFLADGDELCVASDAELQVWTCESPVLREALNDIKLLHNAKLIGASVQQSVVSIWGFDLEPHSQQSGRSEDEDGNRDASNDGAEHATSTPPHSATAAAQHRDGVAAVVADSDTAAAAAVWRSRSVAMSSSRPCTGDAAAAAAASGARRPAQHSSGQVAATSWPR